MEFGVPMVYQQKNMLSLLCSCDFHMNQTFIVLWMLMLQELFSDLLFDFFLSFDPSSTTERIGVVLCLAWATSHLLRPLSLSSRSSFWHQRHDLDLPMCPSLLCCVGKPVGLEARQEIGGDISEQPWTSLKPLSRSDWQHKVREQLPLSLELMGGFLINT